jgi:hypothetical protein
MSGVVDDDGQQWEHCNGCGKFFRFPQNLGYEKPTAAHSSGRDLCVKCVDEGIQARTIKFGNIVPAPAWKVAPGRAA